MSYLLHFISIGVLTVASIFLAANIEAREKRQFPRGGGTMSIQRLEKLSSDSHDLRDSYQSKLIEKIRSERFFESREIEVNWAIADPRSAFQFASTDLTQFQSLAEAVASVESILSRLSNSTFFATLAEVRGERLISEILWRLNLRPSGRLWPTKPTNDHDFLGKVRAHLTMSYEADLPPNWEVNSNLLVPELSSLSFKTSKLLGGAGRLEEDKLIDSLPWLSMYDTEQTIRWIFRTKWTAKNRMDYLNAAISGVVDYREALNTLLHAGVEEDIGLELFREIAKHWAMSDTLSAVSWAETQIEPMRSEVLQPILFFLAVNYNELVDQLDLASYGPSVLSNLLRGLAYSDPRGAIERYGGLSDKLQKERDSIALDLCKELSYLDPNESANFFEKNCDHSHANQKVYWANYRTMDQITYELLQQDPETAISFADGLTGKNREFSLEHIVKASAATDSKVAAEALQLLGKGGQGPVAAALAVARNSDMATYLARIGYSLDEVREAKELAKEFVGSRFPE